MDLVIAASEAQGWIRRPYNPKYDWQSWGSAFSDLRSAAGRCGPHLQAELGTDFGDLVAAIQGTPAQLAASQSVVDGALAKLRARWPEPSVAVAAWLDLVAACRDPHLGSDVLAGRRDLFWAILSAGGRNARSTGNLLAGILADSAAYVIEGRVVAGDIKRGDVAVWPRSDHLAGLEDAQRVALCERVLAAPPHRGHHVVWLAFAHAHIHAGTQVMGPITFYWSHWVRAVVEHGGPSRDHLPAELKNPESWLSATDIPELQDVVLARVDLGSGAIADPVARATDLVHAAVALAKFHTGTTNWKAMNGHLHAVDDRVVSFSPFLPPFEPPGVAPYLDATGDELARLAADLGPHLPAVGRDLHDAIDVLHWWHEAGDRSALAAVLLDVRVVEFVASRAGGKSWHKFLDETLKNAWIRDEARLRLLNTCTEAAGSFDMVAAEHHETLQALYKVIVEYDGAGASTLHVDEALKALPTLTATYPPHSRLGRRLAALSNRLNSPAALHRWSDELESEWKTCRDRLQRVRNALAHGGPASEAVVASVAPFGRQLAARALSVAIHGLLDGRGISAAHAEMQKEALGWRTGLAGAPDVATALFR
ncbi:hypothetical protein [Micromonospora tulbaghiae]|uniref:hypothetical protein n=1 Tax=Micromonospora tulbaghiae TaxID=479978 RepID=UPI0034166D5F